MPSENISRFRDIISGFKYIAAETTSKAEKLRYRRRAITLWRHWLDQRDGRALTVFFWVSHSGAKLRMGEEVTRVGQSIEFSEIRPEEWERLVDFAGPRGQGPTHNIYTEATRDSLRNAIQMAMARQGGEEMPFKTWMSLWRVSNSTAMELVGRPGYERASLIKLDGNKHARARIKRGIKERERVGDSGVVVWIRNTSNMPVAKRMSIETVMDAQPLVSSAHRESRILGIKLITELKAGRGAKTAGKIGAWL